MKKNMNNIILGINQQEKKQNGINGIICSYAKVYLNVKTEKIQILKENAKLSGIYLWVEKESGKKYVGSSQNLEKRFKFYYNINDLKRNTFMIICRALLNHGYSNFSLFILEYCPIENLYEREKHYFDLLEPEYNILKEPGNSFGFKHSDESKTKMREAALGRKFSEETLEKMSIAQKGIPKLGLRVPKSEETKGKISDSLMGIPKTDLHKAALSIAMIGNTNSKNHPNSQEIEVFDLETNKYTIFPSLHEAARVLNIRQTAISKYFLRNQIKPYKGRYIFKKI